MSTLSRRQFLGSALLSGAGLLSTGSLSSFLGCASRCRTSPPTHGKRVLADLHVHPMMNDWLARAPLAVRVPILGKIAETGFNKTSVTWESCHRAGIDLLCAAHFNLFDEWLSMPTDPNPEAPMHALYMMDLLEQELAGPAAPFAKLARNHIELAALLQKRQARDADYRVAVLHALEGGHTLGGSLKPLDDFARRGVALITITHFFNKGIATSPNAYPFFPDGNSPWPHQGLSDFGREVIKRMEELGIIVDATHTTCTALEDILRAASKPFLATHISARTLGDHAYSLFDEHIKAIADRKGMVGIPIYPYMLSNYNSERAAIEHGSLLEVVRTIRYVTKICNHSHKHVGIGSDFAGYLPPLEEMTCLAEIDELRKLLLLEFDNDENVVEDILANNAIAFLQDNWRSGLP